MNVVALWHNSTGWDKGMSELLRLFSRKHVQNCVYCEFEVVDRSA